jgi:LysR family hydrogen peroxide-inducible transcriptional activator
MELHQLHYFVAVAEMGSFSRAAQRCNVSQPSLSQQIIKLEHELGQRLFERLGRSVMLTAAGHALLPQAQRILGDVQAIRTSLADSVDAGRGRLAVGMIPTLAPFVLPPVLQEFRQRFPQAELEVIEQTTDRLLDLLIALELDVCVVSTPLRRRLIEAEELFTERLLLALPAQHPLAQQPAVRAEQLRAEPFIALGEEHCLSDQVNAFCYEQQINPTVICRVTQLSTVRRCVGAGLGVALVPALLAQSESDGQCVYRPLERVQPRRTLVAAWHASRVRSPLSAAFAECVRAWGQTLRG